MIPENYTKSEWEARKIELRIKLNKLLLKICEVTELSAADIRSKTRYRKLADVRAVFSCIAKENYPDVTSPLIGSIINKDHSTILSHFKQVDDVKEKRELYIEIKRKLNESLVY